jgi:hypothetical protein
MGGRILFLDLEEDEEEDGMGMLGCVFLVDEDGVCGGMDLMDLDLILDLGVGVGVADGVGVGLGVVLDLALEDKAGEGALIFNFFNFECV